MHSSKVFWVNGKAVFIFVLNKHYSKSFGYMAMRFLFLYLIMHYNNGTVGITTSTGLPDE
jgi:hypothetical protein